MYPDFFMSGVENPRRGGGGVILFTYCQIIVVCLCVTVEYLNHDYIYSYYMSLENLERWGYI